MLSKIFLYSVLIALVSCDNRYKESNKAVSTRHNDSLIVVINETKNPRHQLRYFDYFNNSQLGTFPSDDTLRIKGENGIAAYVTTTFTDLRYFTLYPGDTVRVQVLKNNEIFSSTNKDLQNKIAFMSHLLFNVSSNNFNTKDNYLAAINSINTFYLKKKGTADSLRTSRNTQIYKEAIKVIEYDRLAAILNLDEKYAKPLDSTSNVLKTISQGAWDNLTFRNVIINYLAYVNTVLKISSPDKAFERIKKDFSTGAVDYPLFYLIKSYKPQDEHQLEILSGLTSRFVSNSKNVEFSNSLEVNLAKYKTNYAVRNSSNIKLLVGDSKRQVTFDQILSEHKNQIIYFDFWASWCGPCQVEMPMSLKLYQTIHKANLPVAFLYLSQDDDMAAWLRKSKEIGLPKQNSYIFLKNGALSVFLRKYNIKSIPRYMIFKNGKVLIEDAVRPSDPQLSELLKKYSNELITKS